jgi:hypothetical protein
MPSDDGLRFHDDQNIRPSRPDVPQRGPEETIKADKCGSRPFAFEYSGLLPQRQDFKGDIHATAEEDTDGSEECGNPIAHESTVVTPYNASPRGPEAPDRKLLI